MLPPVYFTQACVSLLWQIIIYCQLIKVHLKLYTNYLCINNSLPIINIVLCHRRSWIVISLIYGSIYILFITMQYQIAWLQVLVNYYFNLKSHRKRVHSIIINYWFYNTYLFFILSIAKRWPKTPFIWFNFINSISYHVVQDYTADSDSSKLYTNTFIVMWVLWTSDSQLVHSML